MEVVKKGRRWPWILLAISVLIALAPIICASRPLNATEAKLVGTWRAESARRNVLVFTSSRTWSRGGELPFERGNWYAGPGQLAMRQGAASPMSLAGALAWLRYELNRDSATQVCSIEFEGADFFVIKEDDPLQNVRFRRVGRDTGADSPAPD